MVDRWGCPVPLTNHSQGKLVLYSDYQKLEELVKNIKRNIAGNHTPEQALYKIEMIQKILGGWNADAV